MKTLLVLMAGVFLLAGTIPAAQAGVGDLFDVNVALHLQPWVAKNVCTSGLAGSLEFGCDAVAGSSNLVTQGTLNTAYHMYIVILDIPENVGILGVEHSISFDPDALSGVDVFSETVCSELNFAGNGWPNSGGDVTWTWSGTNCQDAVDSTDPQGEAVAVCAALYVWAYDADKACIEVKNSGVYGATDCVAASSDLLPEFPANRGCIGFDQPGEDPCLKKATPVEEATWGDIKRQFSSP